MIAERKTVLIRYDHSGREHRCLKFRDERVERTKNSDSKKVLDVRGQNPEHQLAVPISSGK